MANIVFPFTLVDGTTAFASQVMSDFLAVQSVVNGALDKDNLSPTAGILLAQLNFNPGGPAFNQTTSDSITWASALTTDTVPRVTLTSDKGVKWGPGLAGALDVALQRTDTNTLQLNDGSGGPAVLDMNNGVLENVNISGLSLGSSDITTTGVITGDSLVSQTTVTIGNSAGSTGGEIHMQGSTSGEAVIKVAAAAGTPTFTLPTAPPVLGGSMLVASTAGVLSFSNAPPCFTSASTPYATASAPVFAHGLGVIPRKVWCVFTCTTGNVGYSVGDQLIMYPGGGTQMSAQVDATNVTLHTGNAGPQIVTKGGGAMTALTAADWSFVLYAEA